MIPRGCFTSKRAVFQPGSAFQTPRCAMNPARSPKDQSAECLMNSRPGMAWAWLRAPQWGAALAMVLPLAPKPSWLGGFLSSGVPGAVLTLPRTHGAFLTHPPPGSCPGVMSCQDGEDGRGARGPDEMIQQQFHFISNLTLNFNSLKDKKPRDIRCNEIKQSFSDSKFDHKWALRLLL